MKYSPVQLPRNKQQRLSIYLSGFPPRPLNTPSLLSGFLPSIGRNSTARPPKAMDFSSDDRAQWRAELEAYDSRLEALAKGKADLVSLDTFYRKELPALLHQRDPEPFLTGDELVRLMKWKLSRGKWRPRLLDFVSSLGEKEVELASKKAFASLPDLSKAISNLTVLKGVGPATASAILAVYAPDIAPFMSDEALLAAMGRVKDYTLKQYIPFAEALQKKAKELSGEGGCFTASDVERALWSSTVGSKLLSSATKVEAAHSHKSAKRKRR